MNEYEEVSPRRTRRPWWTDLLIQAGGNILAALIIALYLSAIGVIQKAPEFFLYQIVFLLLIGLTLIGGFTVGHAIESRRTCVAYYILTTVSIIVLLWSFAVGSQPDFGPWVENVAIITTLTTSFLASASIVLFYRSPSGNAFIKRLSNVWRPKRNIR
jgi:hypothetical protein